MVRRTAATDRHGEFSCFLMLSGSAPCLTVSLLGCTLCAGVFPRVSAAPFWGRMKGEGPLHLTKKTI